MKVVLELQDQPSNVRRITVRHDIVIGRGSDCNLRLSAPQVSRRHCFLRVGRDSVSVTDLDSSNGTFIDGTRITAGKRHDIASGSQLALGPIKFIIHVRSDVPVAETANSSSTPDSKRSKSSRDAVAAWAADDSETVKSRKPHEDASAQMDFAVEQAGESSDSHEPTADYADDQFLTNGSANLLSSAPANAESRLAGDDFAKHDADQSNSNQETNDFPDASIVCESPIAHDEPQRNCSGVDSISSPENGGTASIAEDVESAWLSVDDDETTFPEPMNLGNAYVGGISHDAFNDAHAEVIEEVDGIEEVMEVHDFDDVVEVVEAVELVDAETNLEELDEVVEVQDSIEIEDTAPAEQGLHDGQVQDWLNFEDVVEVQETLDVEEVIEVEDVLDAVVISETDSVIHAEPEAELQSVDYAEEVAVIEEVSADAQDQQVEDWLNFEEVVEVHESVDVEDAMNEAGISETEDVVGAEEAVVVESEFNDEEIAGVDYFSDDLEVIEVEDASGFDDVEQIEESLETDAAVYEPPSVEDGQQIAIEDGGDSNWFANNEESTSDAFFENFVSPELKTDNTVPAEATEEDDDIDPDLMNFLKGF